MYSQLQSWDVTSTILLGIWVSPYSKTRIYISISVSTLGSHGTWQLHMDEVRARSLKMLRKGRNKCGENATYRYSKNLQVACFGNNELAKQSEGETGLDY